MARWDNKINEASRIINNPRDRKHNEQLSGVSLIISETRQYNRIQYEAI